jgi:S-adenosylmethionine hydrolase
MHSHVESRIGPDGEFLRPKPLPSPHRTKHLLSEDYDMILTVTDFGLEGPYLTQMKAVLAREAPGVTVYDLFAEAPAFNARATAYLLAAFAGEFPAETVFLCVVDPGVGSTREAVAIRAGGQWFVGPDNGLMAVAARRVGGGEAWRIDWRPSRLSAQFHGRDLFAPIVGRLARGEVPPGVAVDPTRLVGSDWPDDLAEVVYVDHYGNAMTGLRTSSLSAEAATVEVAGRRLGRARTFSDVPVGTAFWYENANGLLEISVNQGRADKVLGLGPGTPVAIHRAT